MALALAAKGKGKGKDKGAGSPGGKGDGKGKGKDFKQTPCWFYNCHENGCTKTAEACTHKHGKKLSKEEAAKLVKPGSAPAAGTRAPSPGKGGGKAPKGPPADEWCRKYLDGTCNNDHCPRVHLEPDVVKVILEKRKVAAAKAKAKPKVKP